MDAQKLSAQPAADTGTEDDFGMVVQSGQTRKQTRGQLRTAIFSALASFVRTFLAATTTAQARAAIGAVAAGDNVASASKLLVAKSIAATGDATWAVNFDGTTGVSAALTLAASGVSPGTYGQVVVDAKGRVTSGAVVTSLANGGTGQAATVMSNLTLQNGWILSAGGRAAYRKITADFVNLELRITGGTAADGTVLATLPAGFRPAAQLVFPCASPPNTALSTTVSGPRVVVNTDGTITCANCTNVVIQTGFGFSLV